MRILGVLACVVTLSAYGEDNLIGGKPADPKQFPASVYSSQGNSRCSATVVGSRVLMIAAHCVSNGGTARFSVLSNSYSARCSHHPDYRNNSTADWSLCKVDKEVLGIEFENLLLDRSKLSVGGELLLTGYGCVRPGGGGGNDGVYRIGEAKITKMPSGSNHDTVTRGGAALCYGDSGGPAFLVDGDERWVVGVNSRGDISTTSYLSSVYVDRAVSWFRSWSSGQSVKICGLDVDALGCRGVVPPEPSDPPSPTCDVELEQVELGVQRLKVCIKSR